MRFASLKSSDPAVRARLQAALFTNRKRNKARRSAKNSDFFLTVAEDIDGAGFGYNSFSDPISGSATYPDGMQILYFIFGNISPYGGNGTFIEIDGVTLEQVTGCSLFINDIEYSELVNIGQISTSHFNLVFENTLILDSGDIGTILSYRLSFF